MKNSPLISIIIPVYNRAHLIGETLDSIESQTYSNWECIIIDDGSTDNIREIINNYTKKDSRFSFYVRPNNYKKGGNGARNYGFTLAKGKYIKWFDSDDVMEKTLLEDQLNSLNGKKISVCLFNKYNSTLTKLKQESPVNISKYNPYYDFITQSVRINLPTTLWEKDVLEQYQLDEYLKKSQEYDFIQRILKKYNEEVVYLNKVLVKTRNHSESITGSFFKANDDKKISDAILVKYVVIRSLDNITPLDIKEKMDFLFFKMLYFAFKHKKTKILFKYLFQVFFLNKRKYFFKLLIISNLYFMYKLFDRGCISYKKYIFHKS